MKAGESAPAGGAAEVVTVVDHAAPERLRILTLQTLAKTHKIDDEQRDQWINEGVTSEEAAQKVLDIIAERAKKGVKDNPARLGLSAVDINRYSLTRAIKACVEKSWPKVAPYEAEISETVARRLGRANSGEHTFFVPLDVQWANAMQREQRDLVVGTASAGGYLVGTAVLGFIDVLRNRSVVMRLGATTLPGLVGSVSIPKKLTSASGSWFATEAGTATESNLTFGQVPLVPKTVGGYVEISRQLLLQSTPNAEGIVNTDLASVIALAVDLAALVGPGTAGQPTGIAATTGVGTANPTAGTNINYADMIRFQTTVAGANAMLPGFGYVTTPTIAGLLMGKPRFTNSDTPIWGGNILDGSLVGARAMTSLQVSSATMFGGDFSQVVVGEWGVLEIEANPYAQFQAGIVGVRALYSCDIGVRYAAAFAIGTGMTA
jgi:HK97 family phage major capsid protein